jgi:hypothetical protein
VRYNGLPRYLGELKTKKKKDTLNEKYIYMNRNNKKERKKEYNEKNKEIK